MAAEGLTFGIYPLSVAGTPTGLAVGPEDNYKKVQLALQDLKGESKKVIPRNYLIYTKEWESSMLSSAVRYRDAGLLGDLVLGCGDWTKKQDSATELSGWLGFIRKVIHQFGSDLQSLQITNEPNLSFMEGSNPHIVQALVEGVVSAKREVQILNLPAKIGFGSVPDGPAAVAHFWESLANAGGKEFIDSVDFVGHNFYVDVFEDKPLDLEEIPVCVGQIMRNLRGKNLVTCGIPDSVPIRIAENGWPTGKNPFHNIERTYERQVTVIETVVRTIHKLREELNISHYEFFGLRDADSNKEDPFHQFGLLRDDYSPKPAYFTFKKLIRELGNQE